MKVSCLYDQGSAQYREDGLFIVGPLFGVLDGVSAPFSPKCPMRKFDSMSGGEMAARLVETFISTVTLSQYGKTFGLAPIALPEQSLVKEISAANAAVRHAQENTGVNIEDAGELAGATFAIAKTDVEIVEIAQAGDCFALAVNYDGKLRITRNQVRLHDEEMNTEILRIQREVAREFFEIALEDATLEQRSAIRGEMWNRFYFILKNARRADVNRPESPHCYGLLNGQSKLRDAMVTMEIPRSELQTLLLFSDGLVPWEVMKGMTDEEVAERVYADYKEGGLAYLLRIARGIEKRVERINYMDSAEATGLALEF